VASIWKILTWIYSTPFYGGGGGRFFTTIDIDPVFADSANGDFTLLCESPCINIGTPDTSGYNLPEYDLAGNPRVYTGGDVDRIDLGAYELQEEPCGVITIEGPITEDSYWCADTIYVVGNVTILDTVRVVICPGTTVLFLVPDPWVNPGRDGYGITVFGQLIAEGTIDSVITFTAFDTLEGWRGIRIFNDTPTRADTSSFDYCIFEYANKMRGSENDEGNLSVDMSYEEEEGSEGTRAPGIDGGALHLWGASPWINNSIFQYNTARDGGAIFLGGGSHPTITNSIIMDNSGRRNGGGICMDGGWNFPYLYNNQVIYNDALNAGGGIFMANNSRPYIEYCNIDFNEVQVRGRNDSNYDEKELRPPGMTGDGGGILCRGNARPTLVNCTINNNSAYNDGGGVKCQNNARLTLIDNLICDNTADWSGGGILLNCTVSNNQAEYYSWGIPFIAPGIDVWDPPHSPPHNPTVRLRNTIIWGNTYVSSTRDTENYADVNTDRSNWHINYCIIEGYWDWLYGRDTDERIWPVIVDLDPKFVDPDNGDYQLMPNSPAINTGTNNTILPLPDLDIIWNPRIYDGYIDIVDMGPYEFQDDPDVQYIFKGFEEDTHLCVDTIKVYTNPYIPEDVSVIICPGTTVMHMVPPQFRGDGYGWIVKGCLFAVGTEVDSILFTAEDPQQIGWSGIYFFDPPEDYYPSRFKYCNIEYVKNSFLGARREDDRIGMGAAINVYDYSNLRISYCDIRYNNGFYGGGIGVHGESYPYIQDNVLHDNFAIFGGGIYWGKLYEDWEFPYLRPVGDTVFVIQNNIITYNWAVSGGGIYLEEYIGRSEEPNVEVIHNEIKDNASIGNLIWWMWRDESDVLDKLEKYDISIPKGVLKHLENLNGSQEELHDLLSSEREPYSFAGGGGIFALNTAPLIEDNDILENIALGLFNYGLPPWAYPYTGMGGGIFIGFEFGYYERDFGEFNPEIINNRINDNVALALNYEYYGPPTSLGAGIFSYDMSPRIVENEINNNIATIEDDRQLPSTPSTLSGTGWNYNNSKFSNVSDRPNGAPLIGFGGGIYLVSPWYDVDFKVEILNNFITGNTAISGGGIVIEGDEEPVIPTNREFISDANINRQGGDDIGSATVIPGLPYFALGTTELLFQDYLILPWVLLNIILTIMMKPALILVAHHLMLCMLIPLPEMNQSISIFAIPSMIQRFMFMKMVGLLVHHMLVTTMHAVISVISLLFMH
jgi:hypothetical protein